MRAGHSVSRAGDAARKTAPPAILSAISRMSAESRGRADAHAILVSPLGASRSGPQKSLRMVNSIGSMFRQDLQAFIAVAGDWRNPAYYRYTMIQVEFLGAAPLRAGSPAPLRGIDTWAALSGLRFPTVCEILRACHEKKSPRPSSESSP